MNILLIDNYDSFTFNLVHYLEGLDCEVTVWRNDEIQLKRVQDFDKIVLSPGPGLPAESNQLNELISSFKGKIPIMGVCLGFQAIIESYGGKLYNQDCVKHGLQETCHFNKSSKLFTGLPDQFKVGLYHSWAASKEGFPDCLQVTAMSENDVIMAFEHHDLPLCGLQFHPESILSENGRAIVNNFICNFN